MVPEIIIYIYFVWFRLGQHFPIVFHCFGNDIIMTSFVVKWFSNLHVSKNCKWTISLQSSSAADCLSLASFMDKLRKIHYHDIISCFWDLKISNFGEWF